MIKGGVSLPPPYSILLILCTLQFTAFSQSNLIKNPKITGDTTGMNWNPFAENMVPNWRLILHSPDLMRGYVHSTPSSGRVWGYVPAAYQELHCEAIGQNIDSLEPGERYAFSMMIFRYDSINNAINGTGTAQAMLSHRNDIPTNISCTECPVIDNSIQKQIIANQTPGTNQFIKVESCFIADDNYDILVLYSDATTPILHWIKFDDIELYKVKADAGGDKYICDTNQCVTIGSDYDSMLNITYSFEWYILGDTNSFASTDKVVVCPKFTTSYLFKFTIAGCSDSDTVTVFVNPQPIVNLGPNDTICGSCKILNAVYDSTYTYLWSTGKTNYADTVCKTGWYWVKVTNPLGCYTIDSVHLVIRPDFNVEPKDTVFCDKASSWPVTLRVKSGFQFYRWSTLDSNNILGNSNTLSVTQAGTYLITVEDSGCRKTDTANVRVLTSPFFNLGPDKELCATEYTICGPFDSTYSYQWSTSETSRCITVNASGDYILEVMTLDSCYSSDTIHIELHTPPTVACEGNVGPFCQGDSPITLYGCLPSGGHYYGNNVSSNDIFNPSVAGINEIYYKFTDTNNCSDSVFFNILVYEKPKFVLDPPKTPVCLFDEAFVIEVNPDSFTGGTWYNTTNDSLFDPSSQGAGYHQVRYVYTDEHGCTDSAKVGIEVMDTFTAYISYESLSLCNMNEYELTARTTDNGDFNYYWNTGDTTQKISVMVADTYYVYVRDKYTDCMDSAGIQVLFTDYCDEGIEADITTEKRFPLPGWSGSYKKLSNITKIIDADLIISQGFTLHLQNVDFIMRNCSKIIVERGGKLIIDSSCIGSCDWEGIEVQGNIDGCSDDTVNSQGYLKISNSVITGANVAIYAGKRDRSGRDVFYGGGIVHAYNNHFENNYVDIMIQEWAFNMICACSTLSGKAFHHEIVSNYFGPLKGSYVCSDFVDPVIDEVNNYYGYQQPVTNCIYYQNALPLERCHIIDLSPYPDLFWSNQPIPQWPMWQYLNSVCCKALWDSRYLPFINGNNCTYDNTFTNPCKNQAQGNKYHDYTR